MRYHKAFILQNLNETGVAPFLPRGPAPCTPVEDTPHPTMSPPCGEKIFQVRTLKSDNMKFRYTLPLSKH